MATWEPEPSPPLDDLLSDPLLRDAPIVEGFKVLDPAVLYAKIGRGGMGAVYRGRHFKLDLDVAVKCLKPSLVAEDQDFVKRFEREARLAASIAHQNVVRVMDVQEKNGLHYLVMEFVRGETAAERVERKGPLAEREALAILLGATAGLAEAHARGIVHRDIKPSNIMVSLEGRVKLADLGLAKSSSAVDGRSMSMLTSVIMGTPQYMPPEQWESTDVTPAADVWALGASLFFLLAGREGIRGGTPLQMAKRIQDQDFPTLRAERPDVRPEVHELFERCMRREPKDRYPDAKALLRALRTVAIDDEDILLDPDTGTGSLRLSTVTPPPRETLLRIRASVETNWIGKLVTPNVVGTSTAEIASRAEAEPSSLTPRSRKITQASRRSGAPRSLSKPRASRKFIVIAVGLGAIAIGTMHALGVFGPPGVASASKVDGSMAAVPAPRGEAAAGAASGTAPQTPAKEQRSGEARAAFARGMQRLAHAEQLDAAIVDLERASELDPSLDEARVQLASAFATKARNAVAAGDLDEAYGFVMRGLRYRVGDRALGAIEDEISPLLTSRLRRSIAISAPKSGAVLDARQVAVVGKADSPSLKALRLAAVFGDATDKNPLAGAAPVQVVAGQFATQIELTAKGAWTLVLEAEDQNGIKARFNVSIQVDPLIKAGRFNELVDAIADIKSTLRTGIAGLGEEVQATLSGCASGIDAAPLIAARDAWMAVADSGDPKLVRDAENLVLAKSMEAKDSLLGSLGRLGSWVRKKLAPLERPLRALGATDSDVVALIPPQGLAALPATMREKWEGVKRLSDQAAQMVDQDVRRRQQWRVLRESCTLGQIMKSEAVADFFVLRASVAMDVDCPEAGHDAGSALRDLQARVGLDGVAESVLRELESKGWLGESRTWRDWSKWTQEQVLQAAGLGDTEALYALAGWYADGDCGLGKDSRKAIECFERASDGGSQWATARLIEIYGGMLEQAERLKYGNIRKDEVLCLDRMIALFLMSGHTGYLWKVVDFGHPRKHGNRGALVLGAFADAGDQVSVLNAIAYSLAEPDQGPAPIVEAAVARLVRGGFESTSADGLKIPHDDIIARGYSWLGKHDVAMEYASKSGKRDLQALCKARVPMRWLYWLNVEEWKGRYGAGLDWCRAAATGGYLPCMPMLSWQLATAPDVRLRNGAEALRWAREAAEGMKSIVDGGVIRNPNVEGIDHGWSLYGGRPWHMIAHGYAAGGEFGEAVKAIDKSLGALDWQEVPAKELLRTQLKEARDSFLARRQVARAAEDAEIGRWQ